MFLALLRLTGGRLEILVVPDHDDLGQRRHFAHLSDHLEQRVHAVEGQNDCGEPESLWRSQWEKQRVLDGFLWNRRTII